MNILVFGLGYVGLSNAFLLAQKNNVICVDIDLSRIEKINHRELPIKDEKMEEFIKRQDINIKAVKDYDKYVKDTDYIIIATPTNFDPDSNYFDTSSVDGVIDRIFNQFGEKNIVIKSTLPIGYTKAMCKKYQTDKIFFSPEFLREGKALIDNLYPSRIIIGTDSQEGQVFAEMLYDGAADDWKEEHSMAESIHPMTNTEAECVKLFSNTYLAMRVSYFNELDTFCELNHLNTKRVINAVSADPRIGGHYNNPSFGYGGYCLPKDTKQLLSEFDGIPNNIIKAIVKSNDTRKKHIAKRVLDRKPKTVGIYRLIMKSGSDNFRESAIFDIIETLKNHGVNIIVYEPMVTEDEFNGLKVCHNLLDFQNDSDLILTNRETKELESVKDKVYSRDIFNRD